MIKSSDADSSYEVKNICLEFDKVTDTELARQIRQQFNGRIAILYDRVLCHRKITKNKSDTLWNINLNIPARSMKGILRFLSTLWPILQVIAHHIQDKPTVSFDSSFIGLINYKWFLTIYAKYSSVKLTARRIQFF